MKQAIRIVISLVLTAGFLFLFLRSFDVEEAWRNLRGAHLALLLASVGVNLSAYVVRAWRWRYLLAPIRERLGMYNLTATTFIGFMTTFVVPFRLGEVVRPVLLARRERLSASAALATIALERLLDLLTVLGLFLVFALSAHGAAVLDGAMGGGEPGRSALLLRRGVAVAAMVVAVTLPLTVILVTFPRQIVALMHRLNPAGSGHLARFISVIERFLTGLGAFRRLRDLLGSAALSLLMWLLIDWSVYLGLAAFGMPLGLFDVFLLMVPLAVGIAVPTPGGVGPYEYLCRIALTDFWGVGPAAAAAAAIALHAITMVPTITVGVLFMWRDGLKPREVRDLAASRGVSEGRLEAR